MNLYDSMQGKVKTLELFVNYAIEKKEDIGKYLGVYDRKYEVLFVLCGYWYCLLCVFRIIVFCVVLVFVMFFYYDSKSQFHGHCQVTELILFRNVLSMQQMKSIKNYNHILIVYIVVIRVVPLRSKMLFQVKNMN